MKKIIVIGTLPSSLTNFRGDFLEMLVAQKYDVIAMASGASQEERDRLLQMGVRYLDYPVQRSGLDPISDFKTYLALRKIFKAEQPDILYAYTIKPIIWGGLAGRVCKNMQFFALVTGLGFAFQKGSFLKNGLNKLIAGLYRVSLKKAKSVIFQNQDNRDVFVEQKIITTAKTRLVNGSGVNVATYQFDRLDTKKTNFLIIARLLIDKGITEYIEAAKIVKAKYPKAVFQIVGPEDPSPNAYPIEAIKELHETGLIEYLGATNDVRPFIQNCQIYVLPSYHEGLPRTVIEAMSMGRPIITTNAPGCRATVVEGENGFLVPVKNAQALAERMIYMIEHRKDWQKMGQKGRDMAELVFDVHKVNESLLEFINEP